MPSHHPEPWILIFKWKFMPVEGARDSGSKTTDNQEKQGKDVLVLDIG